MGCSGNSGGETELRLGPQGTVQFVDGLAAIDPTRELVVQIQQEAFQLGYVKDKPTFSTSNCACLPELHVELWPWVEQDLSASKYAKYITQSLEKMLSSLFQPKPMEYGSLMRASLAILATTEGQVI
ncbi:hypothetical protein F0562_010459 [Nyssa sinensis]|uniref:Uncharacterized protein n=1 Tax=Nyssa sinensis TaxID=561372 RepID=A0A5J5A0W7_9ASTE|nr:hypothetical protein F0562_010459 [Nyssa sinensis]